MNPPYDKAFSWDVNVADLASKLESVLRDRTSEREHLADFPATNVPALIEANEDKLRHFDEATQLIEFQASAARDGYLWCDPDELRTPTAALNKVMQEWREQARKRGRIVRPDQYFKSIHSNQDGPLLVRRGEPAAQFGRGEPGTSPLGFNTARG